MLSRFVIAFLPRRKHLLFSWLKSLSAVILESKKIKSVTASIFPHLFAMQWWDLMPFSYFFKYWDSSQLFHSPLSPSLRGSLVPLHFLPFGWLLVFLLAILIPACNSSSLAKTSVAQRLKRLPTMQETQVRSLGREDPLEKWMATHSSILAWRIPWTEESGELR